MDDPAVRGFHELYYDSTLWLDAHGRGTQIAKCPLDLHIYQEIIHECRPELIIETGSWYGGSAIFLNDMLTLAGEGGHVVTIDVKEVPDKRDGITYLTGSSVTEGVLRQVRERARGRQTMVLLDSNHSKHHVARELACYAPLVSPGQYLIVEDTNVNGHPVAAGHGPGPAEALADWLPRHPEFTPDPAREKFLMTFNPSGYLRRSQTEKG